MINNNLTILLDFIQYLKGFTNAYFQDFSLCMLFPYSMLLWFKWVSTLLFYLLFTFSVHNGSLLISFWFRLNSNSKGIKGKLTEYFFWLYYFLSSYVCKLVSVLLFCMSGYVTSASESFSYSIMSLIFLRGKEDFK